MTKLLMGAVFLLAIASCDGYTDVPSVSGSAASDPPTPVIAPEPVHADMPWEGPPMKDAGPAFPGPQSGPMMILGNSISVNNLAVQQWEEGKLTTHRHQLWNLYCSRSPQRCTVDRLVIDRWSDFGSIVSEHHHSSDDRTMRDVNIDWPGQRLDFTLVFTDGASAQFQLTFKESRLKGFRGYGASKGSFSGTLAAIEYRVAPYSHTLFVPIQAVGLNLWGVKAWDTMIAEFSADDRRAADRFLELWPEAAKSVGSPLEKADPKTEDEVKVLLRAMRDAVERAFVESVGRAQFSPVAEKAVRQHLDGMLADMDRSGEEMILAFRKDKQSKFSK